MNWDPLHELVALRDRATRRPAQPDAAWTPSVDLLETDSAFVLVFELPGLGPDDFTIHAAGDSLTVSGERRAVVPPPERYLRMERGHGRFSRTFTFGEPISVGGVKAAFDRGLLTVTIPKALDPGDLRITIG